MSLPARLVKKQTRQPRHRPPRPRGEPVRTNTVHWLRRLPRPCLRHRCQPPRSPGYHVHVSPAEHSGRKPSSMTSVATNGVIGSRSCSAGLRIGSVSQPATTAAHRSSSQLSRLPQLSFLAIGPDPKINLTALFPSGSDDNLNRNSSVSCHSGLIRL